MSRPASDAANLLRCAKCGSDDINTSWHQGHGRYGSGGCGFYAKVVVYVEHLHRTCRNCQFEWADDTLDAERALSLDACSEAS